MSVLGPQALAFGVEQRFGDQGRWPLLAEDFDLEAFAFGGHSAVDILSSANVAAYIQTSGEGRSEMRDGITIAVYFCVVLGVLALIGYILT